MIITTKSYKELQAKLKDFRDNHGYELTCKLNAKKAILQAEYERIMDLAGDDGTLEAIAQEVNAATAPIIWFTQDEPFTCAYPTQRVEDFIDLEEYADTATQTPESEPLGNEAPNTTLEVNELLAFNHATNALLPMQLVLWTLALVIIPAAMILGWVGNGVVKVVRKVIPLMDIALVTVLGWLAWLSAYLFGDDDELNQSYEQVKQLMKTT